MKLHLRSRISCSEFPNRFPSKKKITNSQANATPKFKINNQNDTSVALKF